MSKIIVSYRRSDSAAITGRIFDRLVDRYGEESVFMDIDRIPFGTDFRHHIQDALRDADVLLAVIGPSWLGKTADGKSRIIDEADPVKVEIEAALKQGLSVIPVLVDNATMPGAADLPESIRDFAYINAAPIDTGRDFRQHMDRLTRSIDGIIGTDNAAMEVVLARGYPDAPKTSWSARRMAAVVGSLAVVLGGAIIAINLMSERQAPRPMEQAKPQSPPPPRQEAGVPQTSPAPPPPMAQPVPTAPPGAGRPPVIAQPKAVPATTYRVLPNVSGGFQNLRRGPAVKYPIVVPIPAGAGGIELGACRPAEDNTKPWCQATWQGMSGWISSCCIVDEKTGQPPRVD
ncbi:MAG: TIR domain-containing protein [Xanthobacteraceae bacterium]|nr:TIR domain-containing protein [Xanthobacteraceae bacterium]